MVLIHLPLFVHWFRDWYEMPFLEKIVTVIFVVCLVLFGTARYWLPLAALALITWLLMR